MTAALGGLRDSKSSSPRKGLNCRSMSKLAELGRITGQKSAILWRVELQDFLTMEGGMRMKLRVADFGFVGQVPVWTRNSFRDGATTSFSFYLSS